MMEFKLTKEQEKVLLEAFGGVQEALAQFVCALTVIFNPRRPIDDLVELIKEAEAHDSK